MSAATRQLLMDTGATVPVICGKIAVTLRY